MKKKRTPHYDLNEIKNLINNPDRRIITGSSRKGAVELGYADDHDIARRVQDLKTEEFDKSMEADKFPGLWQDVYFTTDDHYNPIPTLIYIKLQKSADDRGVVISFKKKDRF